MTPLIQDALIFGAFALSMLAKDVVYTIEMKADANNSIGLAAVADVLGDGLSSVTSIFTIGIVAAGLSRSGEVAQIAGNMAGGFAGVVVGNHVSLLLDRTIARYHRHPSPSRVARGLASILQASILQAVRQRRAGAARTALGTFVGRAPAAGNPHYDRRPG